MFLASNHYFAPDLDPDLDIDLDKDLDIDLDQDLDLDPDQYLDIDQDLDLNHFCFRLLIIILLQT